MPLPDREEIVDANGTRLWTATRGSGPPVVLLHGGPGLCDHLAPVAAMLEDVATVHRYEQRGSGRSPEREPLTIGALLADLDALRIFWGYERWALIGHSWGASLAFLYAAMRPDRVTRLAYVSGVGITEAWQPDYRAARVARLSETERARWHALSERAADDPGADAELLELLMKSDFADASRLAALPRPIFAYPTNPRANARLSEEWSRLVESGSLLDVARSLRVPTLVIHGARDPRPSWSARDLAGSIPGARFVLLEDVGHEPFWERSELLRAELRSFLT